MDFNLLIIGEDHYELLDNATQKKREHIANMINGAFGKTNIVLAVESNLEEGREDFMTHVAAATKELGLETYDPVDPGRSPSLMGMIRPRVQGDPRRIQYLSATYEIETYIGLDDIISVVTDAIQCMDIRVMGRAWEHVRNLVLRLAVLTATPNSQPGR